jgi:CheY-like chemotaxis protein
MSIYSPTLIRLLSFFHRLNKKDRYLQGRNVVDLFPPSRTLLMSSQPRFNVILIDDDGVTNFINQDFLENSNLFDRITVFSDADEAFNYINHHCVELKSEPLPHVLFIDINMPNIDGLEFISKTKDVCPDLLDQTVVCILSTSHHSRDLEKAKELGVNYIFEKPLKQAYLDRIAELLNNGLANQRV